MTLTAEDVMFDILLDEEEKELEKKRRRKRRRKKMKRKTRQGRVIKRETVGKGKDRTVIKIVYKDGLYKVYLGKKIDDTYEKKSDAVAHYKLMKKHLMIGKRADRRARRRRKKRRR